MPPPREIPRTARELIDQALSENRINEYLLYAFAILFVISGTTALIWGMIVGEGAVALAGVIADTLFFPATWQARQIRRENIAIRLVERPLSLAENSKEAADALREFFVETFIKRRPEG
jgi:hypothetical protein